MRKSHAMFCSLIGEVLFKSLPNEQVVLLSEPPLLVTLAHLEALLQDFTSRVTAPQLSQSFISFLVASNVASLSAFKAGKGAYLWALCSCRYRMEMCNITDRLSLTTLQHIPAKCSKRFYQRGIKHKVRGPAKTSIQPTGHLLETVKKGKRFGLLNAFSCILQLVLLTRPLPQPIVLHQSNAITDKELNDGKVAVFSLQLIFFFTKCPQ